MYRPDRNIIRQLKEADPDLDARWDENEGRWWITCLGKAVVKVRNEDGSYRPLDGRIVEKMREQAWEYRTHFGTFSMKDREVRERNKQVEERRKASKRDDFRQYCIEDGYRRVFGPQGNRALFGGWSPN